VTDATVCPNFSRLLLPYQQLATTARPVTLRANQHRKQLLLLAAACDVSAAARALRLDGLADPALVAVLPEDICASPGTCHCRSSDSVPLKRGGETVSDTIGTASVCVFLSWPSTQCGRTAIPLRGENHKGREVRQEVKRGRAPRYKPRTIQENEIMADQPSAGGSLLPSEGGLLLLSAEGSIISIAFLMSGLTDMAF
jgi:hypothetical protein